MQVIVYDGIGKPLEVSSDESIKAVLKHAEALFGAAASTSLSLFTNQGGNCPIMKLWNALASPQTRGCFCATALRKRTSTS